MGLYNFQKRFVPFILSGAKRHTIRATRKNPDVPGKICHLFTGLRTKHTQLLGRFPCVRVEEIRIVAGCTCADEKCNLSAPCVQVGGQWLTRDEREKLARLDGFKDFGEMAEFWEGRLPFVGHITHWKFERCYVDPDVVANLS